MVSRRQDKINNLRFNSPIFPIPICYMKNGAFNISGVFDYLKFLSSQGVKNIMTTAGTSHFNLISHDEINHLNTICAAHFNNAIFGVPILPLQETINYINHAEYDGNFLVIFPERWYDDEMVIDYFLKVADGVHKKILIHGIPMRNAYGGQKDYSKIMMIQLSNHENIIGIKEESSSIDVAKDMMYPQDNFEYIVAGGSMGRYEQLKDYGATSWLTGIGNIIPEIELMFYGLGDADNRKPIILDIEKRFFNFAMSIGWHKALRGCMSFINEDYINIREPFPKIANYELIQLHQIINDIKTELKSLKV